MADDATVKTQRIDKWLWVSRFFKTRSLAAEAVSGGKVHLDGQRVKPAKQIRAGNQVSIRRGDVVFEVEVLALHEQRRPAKEAVLLYEEHPESVQRRAQFAAERAAARAAADERAGRPTKRDRRRMAQVRDI